MAGKLKWYFGPSASEEHGPKDSITTTFKGNKYYSLAREVIQNSLDAIDDKTKPVKVVFSLTTINKQELNELWDLAPRFEMCSKYYSGTSHFQKFCSNASALFNSSVLNCLKISDYNTIGMELKSDGKGPFYSFMKAVGDNTKNSKNSGGSFGFGKGAYYAASNIRTLIVSSVFGDNKCIFQGKARLTTHVDGNGKKTDYTGMFGAENGDPILNSENIPNQFRRSSKGTDIIIAGFNAGKDWSDDLMKSILNNFWYAIYDGKLIVEVSGNIINKDNLEENILNFYSVNSSDGRIGEPETWNPLPYFNAIKYKDTPLVKTFTGEFPILGKVTLNLYLKEGENLPKRIVFMRSPKMAVYKSGSNRGFDYAGVFLCEEERKEYIDPPKGNAILREMENPQHNQWTRQNYLINDEVLHPDGIKAEEELNKFIRECLESLVIKQSGQKFKVFGLEIWIIIPDDPEENGNGLGSSESGDGVVEELTTDETPVETTTKDDLPIVKKKIAKKIVPPDPVPGPDPGPVIHDPIIPNPLPKPKPGVVTPLIIKYIAFAQKHKTGFDHIIKLESNKKAKANLALFVGVDADNSSDNDSEIQIIEAKIAGKKQKIKTNSIREVELVKGINLITVKLDSNQKHSLKVIANEI